MCLRECVLAKPLPSDGESMSTTWSQILLMKRRETLSTFQSFITHDALLQQFNLNNHRVIFFVLFVLAVFFLSFHFEEGVTGPVLIGCLDHQCS